MWRRQHACIDPFRRPDIAARPSPARRRPGAGAAPARRRGRAARPARAAGHRLDHLDGDLRARGRGALRRPRGARAGAARDRLRCDPLRGGLHRRGHDQRRAPCMRWSSRSARRCAPRASPPGDRQQPLRAGSGRDPPPGRRRGHGGIPRSHPTRRRRAADPRVPERGGPRRALRDLAGARHPSRAGRGRDHAPPARVRAEHARGDGGRADRLPRHGHGPRLLRRPRRGHRARGRRDARDADAVSWST